MGLRLMLNYYEEKSIFTLENKHVLHGVALAARTLGTNYYGRYGITSVKIIENCW